MGIEDHPGYYGMTSRGVMHIHARWPMYAEDHGPELALLWLSAFPEGTRFRPLDDIDGCNLLLADSGLANPADPFDEQNLHVALWHEDLLELAANNWIEGVVPITERSWEQAKRNKLPPNLAMKEADGTLTPLQLPPLEQYDDEFARFTHVDEEGLRLTAAGRLEAEKQSSIAFGELQYIDSRSTHLLQLGYLDVAVREACLSLENDMRAILHSDSFGAKLVEKFIRHLSEGSRFTSPFMRCLRGELRLIFKFVRNEFMHNAVNLDEVQAMALLYRVLRARQKIQSAVVS